MPTVLDAYDNRCAVTGLHMVNGGGKTDIHATHIWSVVDGRPDAVQNSIALSRTAAWLFDRHLISPRRRVPAAPGDMAVPWLLPRIVGAGVGRDLSFFPRKLDGAEAHAMGLVSRLWSPEAFDTELEALVARLAGAAPLALKALKSHYVQAETLGLTDYVALESGWHRQLFATEDRTEAFAAYVERRAPRFAGR